jgi:nicotinate-nucleotide pyrophosphorylase
VWGYVKNIVYQVKINDLQHLKAVATVTPNVLQATRNEVEYRLDICRATKGEPTLKCSEKVIYAEKNQFPFVMV